MHFVDEVWENPTSIKYVDNTLIFWVNKVDKLELVTWFRLIALCNVAYKLVTKIIVHHIKPLLDEIISSTKFSFIPMRNIHHNIIIARQMVHSMTHMKGKKVFISIKIDLERLMIGLIGILLFNVWLSVISLTRLSLLSSIVFLLLLSSFCGVVIRLKPSPLAMVSGKEALFLHTCLYLHE